MMQLQQSVGELKASVAHLVSASANHSAKLDRLRHVVFATGIVLVIVLSIDVFFLNKICDGVFILLKATH
jgi:hypothetical protein